MSENLNLLFAELQKIKESITKIEDTIRQIENVSYDDITNLSALDVWRKAKDTIKRELSEVSFNTWINSIKPISIDDNYFYISVPNTFTQTIIKSRYVEMIKTAIKFVTNKEYIIKVSVEENNKNQFKSNASNDDYIEKEQKNIISKYTFDNFIVGEHNKLAYKSVFEFANNSFENPRIIYIYGEVGLGKTHLLKALQNHILNYYPLKKVNYMSIEEFTNSMIDSICNSNKEVFRRTTIENDILILDDLQNIKGKELTQEELIKTIKYMAENGKSVIIGCTKSPQELFILEEKLDLLFEIGEVFEIIAPDVDTSVEILKEKIKVQNIELDEKIIMFIASNFHLNVRELINALNRIVSYNRLSDEKADFDMAVKLLTYGGEVNEN